MKISSKIRKKGIDRFEVEIPKSAKDNFQLGDEVYIIKKGKADENP